MIKADEADFDFCECPHCPHFNNDLEDMCCWCGVWAEDDFDDDYDFGYDDEEGD